MSRQSFSDQYLDVLQNIEFFILQVYREHPILSDWDALSAVEALIQHYRAQAKGRDARLSPLAPLALEVYQNVKEICEWRLGRESLMDADGNPVEEMVALLSLDEVIACLKWIRKSINRWTRVGGRQGYLNFVEEFVR